MYAIRFLIGWHFCPCEFIIVKFKILSKNIIAGKEICLILQAQHNLNPSSWVAYQIPQFIFCIMAKDYTVTVRKLTDADLMREACESTMLGTSHQSLLSIYKSEHSPARTQVFWVSIKNVKLYVSTHLLRHHVGSQPFALTYRNDRGGGKDQCPYIASRLEKLAQIMPGDRTDEEQEELYSLLDELEHRAGRQARTNLSLFINAQSLIDMAKVRICRQASLETQDVFASIKQEVAKCDPDLAEMMVAKCVYRNGLCGEPKCCGYNHTLAFANELNKYVSHFNDKQKGYFYDKDVCV